MTGSHHVRGFTLLEVIVAVTIFSLVILLLFAGYRLGIRGWESGQRMHDAISELRLAGDFMHKYASQAFPLAVSQNNSWRLWFEGESQRLEFITAMPQHLGEGGVYAMALTVEETEEGSSLMVARRLLHPEVAAGRPGVDDPPRVLLKDLESARFEYYGARGEREEASWHRRWVNEQRLPFLVRLRLESKRVGEWPALVVRLPTNAVRYQRSGSSRDPDRSGLDGAPRAGRDSLRAPGSKQ